MESIVIEKNIEVPMRDGTILRADIYRGLEAGKCPVILIRTPYNKDEMINVARQIDPVRAVNAGYTFVIQDVRGRFNSEGDFQPMHYEASDGYDTVEWAASQTWSCGKVGMVGKSYLGITQWLAASQMPPHLFAMIPGFTFADCYEGLIYHGGAVELGLILDWTIRTLAADFLKKQSKDNNVLKEDLDHNIELLDNFYYTVTTRPLYEAVNRQFKWYKEWLDHHFYDEFWKKIAPKEYYDTINIPVFNIGGWYDIFLGGTLTNYAGMKKNEIDIGVAGNQLLIGPWSHQSHGGVFASMDYGSLSSDINIDIQGKYLQFFDYWLQGKKNGLGSELPIDIFIMGENKWKKFECWPLPNTQFIKYYIHSNKRANTLNGDGVLNIFIPDSEHEDVYLFDPCNPVPTAGGQTYLPGATISANAGPSDQTLIEQREDVLCYTTEPLIKALMVIGPVKARIFASSSAMDTDWTCKLVDVHPDGRAFILNEGIIRARYRDSMENPKLLEPGKTYEFEIDMGATANVFKTGHRIRIEISSSNFPRFDVNTNTGGNIAAESYSDIVLAMNKIYHTEQYPSHVILPAIFNS